MVRLSTLRPGHGAGLRQALLPEIGPDSRRARSLRNLFHRLCRPADRSGDLRPLGGSHRTQGDLDRDLAGDGCSDDGRRSRADLREHRHLGGGPADNHPLDPGDGVGGEWGGSVLLAMEWARSNKNRGFLAAWPQFGGPAGLFLANLAVLFFSWLSGDQFLVWGWRIPFLLSIVMVGIGLWIRLGISETPVFQKVLSEERVERVPVLEVLKRQPKQVALTALLRMPEQAPGYIVGTFIFTYATTVLGMQRNFVLMAVLVQAFLGFCWIPVAGHLSDRIGRRRMYIIGSIFSGIFGFIYFALLDTKVPALIFIAIALSLLPVTTCYGPQAAMIAESFTPRLRYSGTSLGYQLASIIAGGPSPFIATALFATFASSFPIALYILGCGILGIIAAAMLTDYTNKDISEEYDTARAGRTPAE